MMMLSVTVEEARREKSEVEVLDEEDEDSYTPLSTLVQQFSFGDPPSRVRKNGGVQNSQNLPFFISKDVLPAHPRQITSPPLEDQMYIVPLPTTVELNVCVTDTRIDKPVVGLASRGALDPSPRF